VPVEQFDRLARSGVEIHTVRAVEFARQSLNFLFDRLVQTIGEPQLAPVIFFHHPQHRLGQPSGSLAALRVMLGHHRLDAQPGAEPDDAVQIGVGIPWESVEGHHRVEAEKADVLDVLGEVAQAARRVESPMISHGARGSHDDGARRLEAAEPAFDIKELLRAQIGRKPRFGNHIVRQFQSHAGGQGGVGALGNIGKGAPVHEGRRPFQGLHQVRMNGVAQKHLHGSHRLNLRGTNRLALVSERHHHSAQPLPQILEIPRQA